MLVRREVTPSGYGLDDDLARGELRATVHRQAILPGRGDAVSQCGIRVDQSFPKGVAVGADQKASWTAGSFARENGWHDRTQHRGNRRRVSAEMTDEATVSGLSVS